MVDNVIKPLKKVLRMATCKVIKPLAKKAFTAGVFHAGEKVGEKAADKAIEKSGDLIRKRLPKGKSLQTPKRTKTNAKAKMKQNEVNTRINNRIARS